MWWKFLPASLLLGLMAMPVSTEAGHCATSTSVPVIRSGHLHGHQHLVFEHIVPTSVAFFQYLPALAVPQVQAPSQLQEVNMPPVASYGDPLGVSPLAREKCAGCHTQGSAKGGYVMFDAGGNLAAGLNQRRALVRVERDEMPPGKPLSEAEKDEFWRSFR